MIPGAWLIEYKQFVDFRRRSRHDLDPKPNMGSLQSRRRYSAHTPSYFLLDTGKHSLFNIISYASSWGRAVAPDGLKWPQMIGRVDNYLVESKTLFDF